MPTRPSPFFGPQTRAHALVAIVPVALALLVYTFALGTIRLGGDEPHYLIMADSLLTDHSFELRQAYERDAATRAIFGRISPHMLQVGDRWMPYHTPGLSMLLAVPLRLDGERGARVTLCLLMALLPWSIFAWLRHRADVAEAAWLTLGIVVCTPTLFGGTRIFPDLPAGVVATACAMWILEQWRQASRPTVTEPSRPRWACGAAAWLVFGAAVGSLPWLNVKYYGTAGVFLIACLAVGGREAWQGRRRTALFALGGAACVCAAVVALLRFNIWAYGPAFGGRELTELTTSFSRAAQLFLGLHFDQSQGLFLRNPLLLAGVLFLPVFVRRHPMAAAAWGALYLSLILPNAMEMARYGGGAPSARFTWSAMWLWVVPIGVGLESLPRLRRVVPALVSAALVYQAALAIRWLKMPVVLFPSLAEQLERRDSLFPIGIRWMFPSFYFWDFRSYWTYGPNLVAFGVTAALLAAGVLLARRCRADGAAAGSVAV